MFRRVLMLTAIVLVFAASNLQAVEIIDSNWVGGSQGEWGNAGNWNPAIVPDNNESYSFFVTIDSNAIGVDRIEVQLLQNYTINQLDTYGDVQLDAPDWEDAPSCSDIIFTVLESITNYGMFEVDQEKHREIEINGNVTNTAGAFLGLYDDKFIRDGNVYNQAGAMIEVADDVDVEYGNIDNAGVIMLVPSSMLQAEHTLHNTGQINVYGGDCGAVEIFDNNSTGIIRGYGSLHGGADFFRNKGKIYAFGGSLTVGIFEGTLLNSGFLSNSPSASLHIKPSVYTNQPADVNNSGLIEVNAGGGVTFDCNLVNVEGANINLLGGTLAATSITQSADANFAGFGGITGDVIIDPNGIIKLTGPTNIVGDVIIDPNATLEVSDGTTLITGHTTCNNGTIHMIGGRVICQGGLTNNNCHIIWEAGTYTNAADFNLDGTVNFKDFADFANTWLWQADWYTP